MIVTLIRTCGLSARIVADEDLHLTNELVRARRIEPAGEQIYINHSGGVLAIAVAEIKLIIDTAYEKARKILTDKKQDLETLANGLLEYETLSGDEIIALLKGIPPERTPYEEPEPQRGPGPSVPSAGVPRGGIMTPEPQPGT